MKKLDKTDPRRSKHLMLALSALDWDQIKDVASANNVTPHDYIRTVLKTTMEKS